ncbi:unnamed protein product [Sphagnum tenellum]
MAASWRQAEGRNGHSVFRRLLSRSQQMEEDEWDPCKNHQSLALVGLGYGALVLNDLFLKNMKEVVTSSTGAGAFVRNLKGFALYSDKDKSYEIEKFCRGRMLRDIEFFFKVYVDVAGH